MVRSNNNVRLHRFVCLVALATLFLVALGGVVTTKGVGMAVPDWPTTYGEHMFLFPPSKWIGGIFDEHFHRLWASLVGIMAAVVAGWTWVRGTSGRVRFYGVGAVVVALGLMGVRKPTMFVVMAILCVGLIVFAARRAVQSSADRLRWLGVIALAAVIIQGVLGGLRVILAEYGWGTEFGIFHAMLAQFFFVFICSLALATSNWWARAGRNQLSAADCSRLRTMFLATTILIVFQLLLGATMRHQHQGLAVPDFPLAYGKVWPATDGASIAIYNAQRIELAGENPITAFHVVVHMLHRLTGVVVLLAIIACATVAWRKTDAGSVLRKIAGLWVGLALTQVVLGILAILSQRKVDVTTAHVAVGALTFMLGWVSVLVAARLSMPAQVRMPAVEMLLDTAELKHA